MLVQGGFVGAQRSDDRCETVLARMKVFHRQTAPLLRYYAANSHTYRVHRIDANGRTQDVFQRLQDCLRGALASVRAVAMRPGTMPPRFTTAIWTSGTFTPSFPWPRRRMIHHATKSPAPVMSGR